MERNCGTGKPKANETFRVHEEPRKAGGTVMAQMRLNARRPGPQAHLICLKGNFGACDAAAECTRCWAVVGLPVGWQGGAAAQAPP